MPISYKSPANSSILNATFLDKTQDDEMTGKLAMTDVGSNSITDTQGYINEIADSDGTIGENDPNRKTYSSQEIISDGDNRKTAVGKLDAQVKINLDKNTTQDGRLSTNESNITTNTNNITTNTNNITTNTTDISTINNSIGSANGIAQLDGSGQVPNSQLPSYVDDVLEYSDYASLPATGETGKIYVTIDDNKQYRWSGSAYVQITSGAVDSVNGNTGVVVLDKTDIGLTNVTDDAQLKRSDNDFATFAENTVHNDNDIILIEDGATGAKKKIKASVLVGLQNVTNDAQLKRSDGDFNGFTEKPAPVDNDIVLIEDSEATFSKKKVKLSNMLGGGGGGGVVSYIENGDAEKSTNDWVIYANTTAGAKPDDFVGTPNAGSSITRTTTSPLTLTNSWILSTNAQGEGAYYEFDINNKDKAQMLLLDLAAIETAHDQFRVFLIGSNDNFVADFQEATQVGAGEIFQFLQFQTSFDSTKYRLCFHQIIAGTPLTLKFEVTSLGASPLTTGQFVEQEVVTYTGYDSVSGTSIKFKTIHSDTSKFLLEVDNTGLYTSVSAKEDCNVTISTGVNFTTTGLYVQLVSSSLDFNIKGTKPNSASDSKTIPLSVSGRLLKGQYIYVQASGAIADVSTTYLSATATKVHDNARISTDLGNRVLGVKYTTLSQAVVNGDIVQFDTKSFDKTNAVTTGASWQFVAQESGLHDLNINLRTNNIALSAADLVFGVDIYAGASGSEVVVENFSDYSEAAITRNMIVNGSTILDLNVGDIVYAKFQETIGAVNLSGSHAQNVISIAKRSSPQSFLEGANVAGYYKGNSGQLLVQAGNVFLKATTKVSDTHNWYNPTTGELTVGRSGHIHFTIKTSTLAQGASGGFGYIGLTVNGAIDQIIGNVLSFQDGDLVVSLNVAAYPVEKGDVLKFQVWKYEPGGDSVMNLSTEDRRTFISWRML